MDFVWTCFMVALGWMFGGLVGGATGIGSIMVAMPLMTAVLTPGEAVLVSCLTGLYGTLHLSYSYRKACCWREIRDLAAGAVPGCVLGALVLRIASMQTLQLMVCAILVCFIGMQFFRRAATYRLPDSTIIGVVAGLICGFVSGSVAMVGAPLGIYCAHEALVARQGARQHERVLSVHERDFRGGTGFCRTLYRYCFSGFSCRSGGLFCGADSRRSSRPPHRSEAFPAHRSRFSGRGGRRSFCPCHGMVTILRYPLSDKSRLPLPKREFRDYGNTDRTRSDLRGGKVHQLRQ